MSAFDLLKNFVLDKQDEVFEKATEIITNGPNGDWKSSLQDFFADYPINEVLKDYVGDLDTETL